MKVKARHLPPLQYYDLRKDMPTDRSLVAWAERGWPASYPATKLVILKTVLSIMRLTAPLLEMLGNGKQTT